MKHPPPPPPRLADVSAVLPYYRQCEADCRRLLTELRPRQAEARRVEQEQMER